jgi:hypothetical protein
VFYESASRGRAFRLLSGRPSLLLLSRSRLLDVGINLGRVSLKVRHSLAARDSLGGGGHGSGRDGGRGYSRFHGLGLGVLKGCLYTFSDSCLV